MHQQPAYVEKNRRTKSNQCTEATAPTLCSKSAVIFERLALRPRRLRLLSFCFVSLLLFLVVCRLGQAGVDSNISEET
jgi:hypothetical protein